MLTVMYDYYMHNEDFKSYVDKYCKKHVIDVLSALKCNLVVETYKYYISENRK